MLDPFEGTDISSSPGGENLITVPSSTSLTYRSGKSLEHPL